jgi:hypothetical protein
VSADEGEPPERCFVDMVPLDPAANGVEDHSEDGKTQQAQRTQLMNAERVAEPVQK